MKRSIMILLAAGVFAVSLQTMAAEQTMTHPASMETCNTLAGDFDAAAKTNPGAAKLGDATKKRDHAMADCKAGKVEAGVKELHAALAAIGAKTPAN